MVLKTKAVKTQKSSLLNYATVLHIFLSSVLGYLQLLCLNGGCAASLPCVKSRPKGSQKLGVCPTEQQIREQRVRNLPACSFFTD